MRNQLCKEPDAEKPQVRFCGGQVSQGACLPDRGTGRNGGGTNGSAPLFLKGRGLCSLTTMKKKGKCLCITMIRC